MSDRSGPRWSKLHPAELTRFPRKALVGAKAAQPVADGQALAVCPRAFRRADEAVVVEKFELPRGAITTGRTDMAADAVGRLSVPTRRDPVIPRLNEVEDIAPLRLRG